MCIYRCEKFIIQIVSAYHPVSNIIAIMSFPGMAKSNLKMIISPGCSFFYKIAKHDTLGLLFPAVLCFHPETLSLYSHNFKIHATLNEYTDNIPTERRNTIVFNSKI